ncbi:MAG: hypothetical protein QW176_05585 [Candidatus Bathyarchaeia archaeon]
MVSAVIRVNVDERLARKFRELAMRKFGFGKGALSRAAEEALSTFKTRFQPFISFFT